MQDKRSQSALLVQLESDINPPLQQTWLDRHAPWLRSPWQAIKYLFTFVRNNTGFVTLLLSIVVAGWAAWRYDISPFEGQQNIATRKQSADAYRQIGDQLVLLAEFEAAEGAYHKALEINQDNVRAMHGLLISEVSQPLQGQKDVVPEVLDVRLKQLRTMLTDPKENYIIPFLEGQRYEEEEEYQKANDSYEESIKQKPEFVGGYINLAYLGILDRAGNDSSLKALERVPETQKWQSALVLNNLGFCYMVRDVVTRDVSLSINLFERSRKISPYFETLINLGDAYRYHGDIDKAFDNHQEALELVTNSDSEKENPVVGNMAVNYMPESKEDKETPKKYERFSSLKEKRILAYYAISLDYALLQWTEEADKNFDMAFRLDQAGEYSEFIANKICSVKQFSRAYPKTSAKNWFEKQSTRLAPTYQCNKPASSSRS
jgi:tetratricopeptide (TPR) repeat protein